MNSPIFCFKAILHNNSKRFGWTVLFKTLAMFLTVILPLFYQLKYSSSDLRFLLYNPSNMLVSFIFATVTAVILFQYLHDGKAVSFLHSLPLSRTQLFMNQTLTAAIFLGLPILVNGIIIAITGAVSANAINHFSELPVLLLGLWVMELVIFAFTALVGMFTGYAAAHAIFALILQILPIGLVVMVLTYAQMRLFGLPQLDYFISDRWVTAFPLTRLFGLEGNPLSPLEFAAYSLIALILLALAWYFYRKRPLEKAGDLITFAAAQPIFKYGFTACVMLAGYLFTDAMWSNSSVIFLVVYALLGYAVAEVLLRKSFRILGAYKGFLGFMAVAVLLELSLQTGFFGYEQRIPPLEKIESAVLCPAYYIPVADLKNPDLNTLPDYFSAPLLYADMRQPESIQLLRSLQQECIDRQYTEPQGSDFYLIYRLKNGGYLTRIYRLDSADYPEALTRIADTEEFRSGNPVLALAPADLSAVLIRNEHGYDSRNNLTLQTLIPAQDSAGFLSALGQDIATMPPQAFLSLNNNLYGVEFQRVRMTESAPETNYYTSTSYYSLNPYYLHTIEWLEAHGLLSELHWPAAEIKRVTFTAVNRATSPTPSSAPTLMMEPVPATVTPPYVITDPEAIAAILAAETSWQRATSNTTKNLIWVNYYTEAEPREIANFYGDDPNVADSIYLYYAEAEAAPASIAPYVQDWLQK